MKWEKTTIGDHCTVTSSKRFHLSERTENGIPFYCSKEIIQKVAGKDVTECDYIPQDLYENIKEKYGVPQAGDLLITTRGTYGVPYIYSENDHFYFADGNLTWLKDFDDSLSPKFLYYWIRTHEGQMKIDAIAKGTAQKAVPIASIKRLEIHIPPIEEQHRIASILSAYDDLIENNQKQIKLLEEAAQRLYKEWFVDLRFPGYETTRIVDGVPEGWRRCRFSDVVTIMSGGTPDTSNSEYYNGTIPFYTPKDADGSYVALDTQTHISEEGLAHCHSPLYPAGTVIITARGTVGKTTVLGVPMAMNQSCYALKSDVLKSPYYLFFALNKAVAELKAMANGGVFDTIVVKTFDSIMVDVPQNECIGKFERIVKPLLLHIEWCLKRMSTLTECRNNLLVSLISQS